MANRVAALVAKVNKALSTTNTFDRKVYIRTTTSTGGDPLIGRYGTLTITDMLLDPQPMVERLGRERIPGGHAISETYIVGSNMKIGDDYSVFVSSSMISLTQLQSPNVQIVFKDTAGGVEVLSIHDFETITIDSGDVAYAVYCRSGQIT
jgi:hypothetical protein